jgi:putative oxidoreductase
MLVMNTLFGGVEYRGVAGNLGLLLGRIGFGLSMFFLHGMGKFPPSEGFISGIGAMGFPAPELFAWASFVAEGVASLLVAVGLLTRPAALLIAINMGVAFFIKHSADGFDVKEKALLFLLFGLIYLFAGAGRFSLDRLIKRTGD